MHLKFINTVQREAISNSFNSPQLARWAAKSLFWSFTTLVSHLFEFIITVLGAGKNVTQLQKGRQMIPGGGAADEDLQKSYSGTRQMGLSLRYEPCVHIRSNSVRVWLLVLATNWQELISSLQSLHMTPNIRKYILWACSLRWQRIRLDKLIRAVTNSDLSWYQDNGQNDLRQSKTFCNGQKFHKFRTRYTYLLSVKYRVKGPYQ